MESGSNTPAAPAWVCGDCGATADGWNAQCGHCGAFDRLDWRRPPRVMPLAVAETAPKSDGGEEPSDGDLVEPVPDEEPKVAGNGQNGTTPTGREAAP